jgi:hydrogenase expression/formation protein HypC
MCLAIPGEIVEFIDDNDQLVLVDVVGVKRRINIGLMEPGEVAVGDWILIHVGFAMSKVDEDEARATHDGLVRLGADYEQELEDLKASVIE